MSKTVWDIHQEAIVQYGTENNTFEMFPMGTRVKIITPCEDFNFFYGETGTVKSNKKQYLSIYVEYDEPRHYKDGTIEKGWGFNPQNLIILKEVPGGKKYSEEVCQWANDWM